ncbi:MAG: hypothetical protein JKY04_08880 [Sneathiella sp.]|nr:hypothetical protein [Sneathiella sp.]
MTEQMDGSLKAMVEECYLETVLEAMNAGHSKLVAHKEGVTGAAMLLVSLSTMGDDDAKSAVVALNLRPSQLEAN